MFIPVLYGLLFPDAEAPAGEDFSASLGGGEGGSGAGGVVLMVSMVQPIQKPKKNKGNPRIVELDGKPGVKEVSNELLGKLK